MKHSIEERLVLLESVVFSEDDRTSAPIQRRSVVTPSHAVPRGGGTAIAKLTEIQREQRVLTAVVEEALALLNFSRTYEKRLERLESAVFGKPQ